MKGVPRPTYDLDTVNRLVRDRHYEFTGEARLGRDELDFDPTDSHECLLRLGRGTFRKSMPSETKLGYMQDVHHICYLTKDCYIKVQIVGSTNYAKWPNGSYLAIISFKPDED